MLQHLLIPIKFYRWLSHVFLILLLPTASFTIHASPSSAISLASNSIYPIHTQTTFYGTSYSKQEIVENTLYALLENTVAESNFELKTGIAIKDKELELNQFSWSYLTDDYELKLGSYVTQLGVFDLASSLNSFNGLRVDYFNDSNIHVRRQSSLLAEASFFPNDFSTFKVILAPYDRKRFNYSDQLLSIGLESAFPYLLVNSGDATTQIIIDQILLPVYENDAKPAIYDYIERKQPEPGLGLDTTSLALNLITYLPSGTFGLVYINGLSNLPFIKLDSDLVLAAQHYNDEDRAQYFSNYLSKEDNEPIKSIEYLRYHQATAYAEGSYQDFGLRAELGYRDRFPLLNQISNQFNLGLGIDHKSWIYNNLEIQLSYLPQAEHYAHGIVWQALTDPLYWGPWQITLENTASYLRYETDYTWLTIPGLNLSYENIDVKFKFFHHHEKDYSNDFAQLQVKVLF